MKKYLAILFLFISFKSFGFTKPDFNKDLMKFAFSKPNINTSFLNVKQKINKDSLLAEFRKHFEHQPGEIIILRNGWRSINGHNIFMFWSDHVIGSGSGTVSQTSMSGLIAGDRLLITAGSYTTSNFSNLNDITIIPNTTTVTFTNTMTWGSNSRVTIDGTIAETGFTFSGNSGAAIDINGHNEDCIWRNITGNNVNGDFVDANTGATYSGTTATLVLYRCTFENIDLNSCDYFIRGSFGDISSGTNFNDSLILRNISIDQTQTNGEQIRGVFFRVVFDSWSVTYSGLNPSGGDVGLGTVYGQGYIFNCVSDGMAGYVWRNYCATLIAAHRDTYFYNNVKVDGTRYGMVSVRIDAPQFGTYTEGCDSYIFNNTELNCSEDGGYISTFNVWGSYAGFTTHMHNNLVINNVTGGSHILQNDSGGNGTMDSSNNRYLSSNTAIDGVTFMPLSTSAFRNAGTTKSWMKSTDRVGHTWEVAGKAIGSDAFFTAPAGCGAPDCMPNRRKTKYKN